MHNFIIKKVAVLGAGVMGAQIAAHCINARVPVILFDLPAKEGNRHAMVQGAIENLKKINPPPLCLPQQAAQIETGNYEDDLARLEECDLIIEAIAERMEFKHALYQKIVPHLAEHAILATNTSGLPIAALANGLDALQQSRFCGIHFFNPPRYMHLIELIPAAHTKPETLDQLETFLTTTLGKGVIRALDTPNFIANRVGIFSMLSTFIQAEKFGLTVDIVDDLTGSKLGRAKSGTFRTADVVGLDTMSHVIQTMQDNLQDDPFHAVYRRPELIEKLLKGGALGQKNGAGFYKKVGKTILRIDPTTAEYVQSGDKADDFIGRILKEKNPARRMQALHDSSHPQARFLWAIFRDMFHYLGVHLEHIADNARDIDLAMRWGYGWRHGPFEIWQAAGWTQVAQWVKEDIEAGKALNRTPLQDWVFDGRLGVHVEGGSWSPRRRKVVPHSTLPVYARQAFRANVLGSHSVEGTIAGTTVFEDEHVRIWHQDDDVLVLSFKTRMHVISSGVTAGITRAIQEAEARYKGLVIWHADAAEGEAFSAGADLKSMLPLFMSGGAQQIEPEIIRLQQAHQALKYAHVPVVAAVAGLALGGGCELLMHATRRVATMESYIGLVEVGVGLIPAGGGLKEMAVRAAKNARGNDILPFLKHSYQHAATATVSRSAVEAREMGYLDNDDIIICHPHELLYVAKNQVKALHEAGYRAPFRTPIPVVGRHGIATIGAQLLNMRDGGFISSHDYKLGLMIADVVCGGDLDAGVQVDEQWLLDRERMAFMELLEHPKTQERIMGMMQTGKAVRN